MTPAPHHLPLPCIVPLRPVPIASYPPSSCLHSRPWTHPYSTSTLAAPFSLQGMSSQSLNALARRCSETRICRFAVMANHGLVLGEPEACGGTNTTARSRPTDGAAREILGRGAGDRLKKISWVLVFSTITHTKAVVARIFPLGRKPLLTPGKLVGGLSIRWRDRALVLPPNGEPH